MRYCCDEFKKAARKGDLYTTEGGYWTMDDDKISKYFYRANNMWGMVEEYPEEKPMTDKILCMQAGLNGVIFPNCPFCEKELKSAGK